MYLASPAKEACIEAASGLIDQEASMQLRFPRPCSRESSSGPNSQAMACPSSPYVGVRTLYPRRVPDCVSDMSRCFYSSTCRQVSIEQSARYHSERRQAARGQVLLGSCLLIVGACRGRPPLPA